MRVSAERLRYDLLELRFDFLRCFARCEARSVGDAEYMRVDGESFFPESGVQNHVCRFAADSGERLKLFTGAWNLTAEVADQRLRQGDDILCLGIEQANRLDLLAKCIFAEIDHPLGSAYLCKQWPACGIDAGIRGLSRKHNRYQQSVGIGEFEFCSG